MTLPFWSPERRALVRANIDAGLTRKASLALINALPGPQVGLSSLCNHLYTHGLKLTDEARLALARTSGSSKTLRKGAPLRMTPERLAYLTEAFPRGDDVESVIYPALMAIPGPPIKSPKAVYEHAKKNGLKRPTFAQPKADPEERRQRILERRRAAHAAKMAARPPKPEKARPPVMAKRRGRPPATIKPDFIVAPVEILPASPERADAVTNARYAAVMAAISRKNHDATDIARQHGMPLREVLRLKMVARMGA